MPVMIGLSASLIVLDTVYIDLPLSYIHLEKDLWEGYYLRAVSHLGWNKKLLLTQIASAFCTKNKEYLLECCDLEAAARGLEANSAEFFDLYSDWRQPLPDYRGRKFPSFPKSPLSDVIDPEPNMSNRRAFANIRLSQLHSVYLRVASAVDRGSPTATLMSRITKQHFQMYGAGYLYQFAADDQRTIRPEV